MKAIILAGGEGSRLRPLSLVRPKPMLRLLGIPLLEHLVRLLAAHGYRELCMTLGYLPEPIRAYFGDGAEWDVSLEYRVEKLPLGTAGSVGACRDFAGNEEVLVISGDAACAADLTAFRCFHREKGGAATLLARPCRDALEYGLVLADPDGRGRGFIEKPSPDRVCTDLVNTGIYLLKPEVLDRIPREGTWDFASDLFPALLGREPGLFAWESDGYWNDVGTPEAYLRTSFDALDGRLPLTVPPSRTDAPVIPPCWISPQATVDRGARVGPYAVIGPGSRLGAGCRVDHSIVDGAAVSACCRVTGSVLAQGVYLGEGTEVREGCILAEGVTVGAGSFLQAGVKVWPGKTLAEGCTLTRSLAGERVQVRLCFDGNARLRGRAGTEYTPELLLRMGASGSGLRRCGAASGGGGYAALLALAFLTGSASAGRETFRLDSSDPASAAWASAQYGLDLTLFIRQEGERLTLYFFDRAGLPLPRKRQRELEAAGDREGTCALPEECRDPKPILGTEEAHAAAAAAGCGPLPGFRAAVTVGRSLVRALRCRQAEILPPETGIPVFRLSEDRLTLEATDEEGRSHPWDRLLCALLRAELRAGQGPLCLPYAAPEAAEEVAAQEGERLLRLGRDGREAEELWRLRPYARDGLFLALRLCHWLHSADSPFQGRLADLMDSVPPYETRETELSIRSGSGRLLRVLRQEYGGETVSGLKLRTAKGCATISPDTLGKLRIRAESTAMEAAGELCAELRDRLRELDG